MGELEPKLAILIPDGVHIRPVVLELLNNKGFQVELRSNGSLHVEVRNSPVTLTMVSSRNIPSLVAAGQFLAGFVGSDRSEEFLTSLPEEATPPIEEVFRFSLYNPRVRLSLLVRDNLADNERLQSVAGLEGGKVVTSYPALARQYFGKQGVAVEVEGDIKGKEEGLVAARYADGAIVIVDSGTTMAANSLRELDTLMRGIQPVVICNLQAIARIGRVTDWEEFLGRLANGAKPARNLGNLWGFLPPM